MKLCLVLLTILCVEKDFGKPIAALANNNYLSKSGSPPQSQQLRRADYNDFEFQDTYAYPGLDDQTNIIYVYRADELAVEQILEYFKLEAEKDAATTPAPGRPPTGAGFGGGGVPQKSISGAAIGSLLGIGGG